MINSPVVARPAQGFQRNRFSWPVVMLVHRFVLFLAWQAVIAGAFAVGGAAEPWTASVAWWPISVTLTNVISYILLRYLAASEGLSMSQLINADFNRKHLGKDLLALFGVLLLAAPLAMIPNLGLAQLLFGDVQTANDLFFRALPAGVALITLFSFPITQSFGELPTYFGYVMPRLADGPAIPLRSVLVAAFWLGLQHMTLPLIPDLRFMLWRGVMFIPFALLLGLALRWRPRLLPYLLVVHALIDFPVSMMVYQVSVK